MKIGKSFSKAATMTLLGLSAYPALASVITYADDKTNFLSSTSATPIGALPSSGANGTAIGNVTFTSSNPIVFGNWSNEIGGFDLAISGAENFNMTIASSANSIAFDMHEPTTASGPPGCNAAVCVDSPFTIELFSGTTSLGTFQYNAPDDVSVNSGGPLGFFGVYSSISFNRVEVRDVNGNLDNEYFGNFLLGNTTIPVSAPSTLLLVLGGIAVLRFHNALSKTAIKRTR